MRPHIVGVTVALLAALLPASRAIPTHADTGAGLVPPSILSMSLQGGKSSILQGGWINRARFEAHFQVTVGGAPVTPQVELQPSTSAFTGQPGFSGPPLTASGQATVPVTGLANGKRYHWQARVSDSSGNASAWVPFGASGGSSADIGVDETSPSRPIISSPTNPKPNRWYNVVAPVVHWRSHDALSGIRGYAVQLLRWPRVISGGPTTPGTGARLSNLADGVWWVAVRSEDNAGNWSPTATFKLQLDRQPLRVWWQSAGRIFFNPYRGPLSVKVKVSKNATLRLALWRVGDRAAVRIYAFPHVRAEQLLTVVWNGRDQSGHVAKKGYYYFSADASDRANNFAHANIGAIFVSPAASTRSPAGVELYPDDGKRIIVSLSQQTLYAYSGVKLLLRTYVTTGNPSLPTPAGSYTVMAKYSPFEFVSPWPPGSPYWYPPSWTTYAMLFRDGGYFLHDAPWRSTFGPGTNGPGQPGTNYGGTHGCVNIPPSPMRFLWGFAQIGTRVDVVP